MRHRGAILPLLCLAESSEKQEDHRGQLYMVAATFVGNKVSRQLGMGCGLYYPLRVPCTPRRQH